MGSCKGTRRRGRGYQPVEEVILPADGSFGPGAASEILDESTDLSVFVFLAPARNPAPSATEHFVNGLLFLGDLVERIAFLGVVVGQPGQGE